MKNNMDKDRVLTNSVKHLFNTIDEKDILREEGGVWFLMGQPMSDGQKNLLISEAETFTKMSLWKILMMDVKYQANKQMFERSQSLDDLILGKSWLYVLDCLNTRLESMCKKRGTFNAKI